MVDEPLLSGVTEGLQRSFHFSRNQMAENQPAVSSTSTAVALSITARLAVPMSEFTFTHSRSSGPGGQNVNKVNSRVTLRWFPRGCTTLPIEVITRFCQSQANQLTVEGEWITHSDRFRDQHKNHEDCLIKLAALLRAAAAPPKPRRPTKPSAGANRRRLVDKKQRQETKAQRRPPSID